MDSRNPLHLTLRVEDLGRALIFWHERLCVPVKLRGEGWAELQTDTILLTLVEGGAGPSMILGWEVERLEEAMADLAERGISAGIASDARPGRQASFQDPDGHALEIIEP